MLNMVKIIFRMRGFAWYARTVPVLLPLAQVKKYSSHQVSRSYMVTS